MERATATLLCTLTGALVLYNVWVWTFHDTGTISSVMYQAMHRSPWIPLVVGLVIGHWIK